MIYLVLVSFQHAITPLDSGKFIYPPLAQPIRMAIADARKLYLQSQNRFVDVLEETTAADSKKAN